MADPLLKAKPVTFIRKRQGHVMQLVDFALRKNHLPPRRCAAPTWPKFIHLHAIGLCIKIGQDFRLGRLQVQVVQGGLNQGHVWLGSQCERIMVP
jgi:hypothetical protein